MAKMMPKVQMKGSRVSDTWEQGRSDGWGAAGAAGPVVASGVRAGGHRVLSHDLSCLPGGLWFQLIPSSFPSFPCLPQFCKDPYLAPDSQNTGLLWAAQDPQGHRRERRDRGREGGRNGYETANEKLPYNTGSSDWCSMISRGGIGGRCGRKVREEGNIGMLMADSCCCAAETNTTL